MYFKANQGGISYEINIYESSYQWHISFKQDDQDWRVCKINKTDYRRLDRTVSFVFDKSSYLMDVAQDGLNLFVYTRGSHRFFQIYNEQKTVA